MNAFSYSLDNWEKLDGWGDSRTGAKLRAYDVGVRSWSREPDTRVPSGKGVKMARRLMLNLVANFGTLAPLRGARV